MYIEQARNVKNFLCKEAIAPLSHCHLLKVKVKNISSGNPKQHLYGNAGGIFQACNAGDANAFRLCWNLTL